MELFKKIGTKKIARKSGQIYFPESIGNNRVFRLMRKAGLQAQVGYRKPRRRGGKTHIVTPNTLNQNFDPDRDRAWVTVVKTPKS